MLTTRMPASTAFLTTGTSAFESAGASTSASTRATIICSIRRICPPVSVSSRMPLASSVYSDACVFWWARAPFSMVRKNSLASDFITSAILGGRLAARDAANGKGKARASAEPALSRRARRRLESMVSPPGVPVWAGGEARSSLSRHHKGQSRRVARKRLRIYESRRRRPESQWICVVRRIRKTLGPAARSRRRGASVHRAIPLSDVVDCFAPQYGLRATPPAARQTESPLLRRGNFPTP